MGSLSLLQGIFPTQGLNPGVLHCRRILYQLSHKGSPRILEWVAYPFSRGSSQPRDQTGVSCIAGGSFTSQAIREALYVRNSPKAEVLRKSSTCPIIESPATRSLRSMTPRPLLGLITHRVSRRPRGDAHNQHLWLPFALSDG